MSKKTASGRFERSVTTTSAAETRRVGRVLAGLLRPGDVVTLSGALGAGKTTFAQGLVKALGYDGPVSSPTFTLIHEYDGPVKVYHLDWYRLSAVKHADRQLALECLADPEGVVLIEWPQRGRPVLPRERVEVTIRREGIRRKISWTRKAR